jgi:hypothetical protein
MRAAKAVCVIHAPGVVAVHPRSGTSDGSRVRPSRWPRVAPSRALEQGSQVVVVCQAGSPWGTGDEMPRCKSVPGPAQPRPGADGRQRPLVPRCRCLPRLTPGLGRQAEAINFQAAHAVTAITPFAPEECE